MSAIVTPMAAPGSSARRTDAVVSAFSGLRATSSRDAPAAMKGAAKVYKADFTSDYAYHAQMEPMNVTAKVDDDGQGADIWVGTQAPDLLAAVAAGVL